MKWRIALVLVLLCALLVSISSSALTPSSQVKKVSDPGLKKVTNSSLATQKSSSGDGFTFFDGKQIIQNKTVMENALKPSMSSLSDKQKIELFIAPSEESSSPSTDPYQYLIDWAKTPDHVLKYSLINTNGAIGQASQGALGYSSSTRIFIGDKYDWYYITNNELPPHIEQLDGGGVIRVMVNPVEKKVIEQFFSAGEITPHYENPMDIEQAYFMTSLSGKPSVFLIGNVGIADSVFTMFIECT